MNICKNISKDSIENRNKDWNYINKTLNNTEILSKIYFKTYIMNILHALVMLQIYIN